MAKQPYMPFWVFDWRNDEFVQLLGCEGRGLYLDALVQQWIEGSLPPERSNIQRLLGTPDDVFERQWSDLETKFPMWPDGRRRNHRCAEQREWADRRSSRARDAANARWAPDEGMVRPYARRHTADDPMVDNTNKTKGVNAEALPFKYQNPKSKSKDNIYPRSRFTWDQEKKRIWAEQSDRNRLRDKWLEQGMTADEFQRQMRKLNRYLDARPAKRGQRSNFANRINNWMNNFVDEKERREDET